MVRFVAPEANGSAVAAAVLQAELGLATTPSAAGKVMHFTVLARTSLRAFGSSGEQKGQMMPTITLLIDRGDGQWLASNGGILTDWAATGTPAWMANEWDVHSFAARMEWSGTARFAVAVAATGVVDVATVKVAQVGV